MWVLLGALTACDTPGPAPADSDPVEVAVAERGAAIAGCESGGFTNGTLALDLAGDGAVLSVVGGRLTANGFTCMGVVQNVNQALTTKNTAKILFRGSSSDDTVVLDMLPGAFGPRILSNAGGITVDFAANSGGSDSFMIRGGSSPETYKFASSTTTDDVYVEISGDKVADIRLIPGSDMDVAASMGAGGDTVIGNPAAIGEINTFAGTQVMIEPLDIALTVFGGAGDDKFTGGRGDDTFAGGEGNDLFRAAAFPDGNDVYTGDQGTDTVDYGIRSAPLAIDIGPPKVARVGNADLAALDYAMLAGKTLVLALDGSSELTVTFASPANPADVLAQINQVAGAGVASITLQNQLMLSSTTSTLSSMVRIDASSTAIGGTLFDLPAGTSTPFPGTALPSDADDGESGEADDVRSTIENIIGGKADDQLFGDAAKNTIKAGAGNDRIGGGSRACAGLVAADGDMLQGEAGDDVFFMPAHDCFATLVGGAGDNTADFSGRSTAVRISNDGSANDGVSDEKVNVGADILYLIGGFGGDTLAGGKNDDVLVGGPGGDVLNGGVGADDTVDYGAYDVATTVTACFHATIGQCGAANDGAGEDDQVYLVEHLIGGSATDIFSVVDNAPANVTFEGRAGDDQLTGGDGHDRLWGDQGADTLTGGKGDDFLTGGDGVDVLAAGEGDGDICFADDADAPAAVGCEL